MKLINITLSLFFFFSSNLLADENIKFNELKNKFKFKSLIEVISEETFDLVMKNTKFLPKVIGYDRYQPEF